MPRGALISLSWLFGREKVPSRVREERKPTVLPDASTAQVPTAEDAGGRVIRKDRIELQRGDRRLGLAQFFRTIQEFDLRHVGSVGGDHGEKRGLFGFAEAFDWK